jgi:hypothetical protein
LKVGEGSWAVESPMASFEFPGQHDDAASLVAFYVREHNEQLPHSAFRGQTPDEMYFGRGQGAAAQLERAKRAAREARLAANRSLSCSCYPVPACTREAAA